MPFISSNVGNGLIVTTNSTPVGPGETITVAIPTRLGLYLEALSYQINDDGSPVSIVGTPVALPAVLIYLIPGSSAAGRIADSLTGLGIYVPGSRGVSAVDLSFNCADAALQMQLTALFVWR